VPGGAFEAGLEAAVTMPKMGAACLVSWVCALDRGIAVIGHRLEDDIRREAVGVPLKRDEFRHRLRRGGAGMLRHRIKNQIMPRRGRAGHEKLPVFSGGDQRTVELQPRAGKIAAKGLRAQSPFFQSPMTVLRIFAHFAASSSRRITPEKKFS